MSKTHFRMLILCSWVLTFVAVVAHFTTQRTLPPELQAWLEAYRHDLYKQLPPIRLALDLIYIAFYFVDTIGLLLFKKWAKALLIPMALLGYVLIGVSRINVDVQWVISLKSILSVLYGVIIALVYYSPLSQAFEESNSN